jgi:hypothetical protein
MMILMGSAVCLFLVLTLDAAVTRSVVRAPFLAPKQRRAQIVIVWALPIVGALLVWRELRRDEWPVFRGDGAPAAWWDSAWLLATNADFPSTHGGAHACGHDPGVHACASDSHHTSG